MCRETQRSVMLLCFVLLPAHLQAGAEDKGLELVRIVNQRLDRIEETLALSRPMERLEEHLDKAGEAGEPEGAVEAPVAVTAPDDIPARLARWRLRGIAYRTGERVAVVNDLIAEPGTMLDSFEVVSIATNSVTVVDDQGGEHELRLDEDLDQYNKAP